jgi:hypothetical protein
MELNIKKSRIRYQEIKNSISRNQEFDIKKLRTSQVITSGTGLFTSGFRFKRIIIQIRKWEPKFRIAEEI